MVNPIVKVAWRVELPPPGDGLLETVGRHTSSMTTTPDSGSGSSVSRISGAGCASTPLGRWPRVS